MKELKNIAKVYRAIILFCFVLLVFGCGSGSSSNQPSDIVPVIPEDSLDQREGTEVEGLAPNEENELIPYYAQERLSLFTRDGVVKFYALNRRVPVSFEEYIESGFPMIIPTDFATGEPYHLTDELNPEDTTGFTFWSDGADSCKFTFVINSMRTNENESMEVDLTGYFDNYKIIDGVPGIFAPDPNKPPGDSTEYFNRLKQGYCLHFFGGYYNLVLNKYRALGKYPDVYPSTLKDIFEGEGTLIKKGWEWTPDSSSKAFFEFGIDPPKMRCYQIWGCKRSPEGKPCRILIHQIYGQEKRIKNLAEHHLEYVEGRDWWEFTADEDIPSDVLVKNKMVSSESFIDAYYSILN